MSLHAVLLASLVVVVAACCDDEEAPPPLRPPELRAPKIAEGHAKRCSAKAEVCNRADDDCDGLVDDECVSSGGLLWASVVPGAESRGIAPLSDGGAVVAGRFMRRIVFEAPEGPSIVLTSTAHPEPQADVFLAKYRGDGAIGWAKQAGGRPEDEGNGVAVARDSSIFVTGNNIGASTFGRGEKRETTLGPGAATDQMFLAKYDADGAIDWARNAIGLASDIGTSVAATPDGGAVVTGQFGAQLTFAPGDDGETTLTAEGSPNPNARSSAADAFIATYDISGTLAWAKRAGGSHFDRGNSIAVLSDGSAIVSGTFNGSAVFGPGEPEAVTLSTPGGSAAFVARYSGSGAIVWALPIAGALHSVGSGVAATDGGFVAVGTFMGDVIVRGVSGREFRLTSAGGSDAFVVRYDNTGEVAWAKRAGGISLEAGILVASSPDGSALVAGEFIGDAKFGEVDSAVTLASQKGSRDIFIAKYDRDGVLVWAKRAGGDHRDRPTGVAVDSDGQRVLLTGMVGEGLTFGESGTPLATPGGPGMLVCALAL